jgi:hypothetical protein
MGRRSGEAGYWILDADCDCRRFSVVGVDVCNILSQSDPQATIITSI